MRRKRDLRKQITRCLPLPETRRCYSRQRLWDRDRDFCLHSHPSVSQPGGRPEVLAFYLPRDKRLRCRSELLRDCLWAYRWDLDAPGCRARVSKVVEVLIAARSPGFLVTA
jgi:hypothetical protein